MHSVRAFNYMSLFLLGCISLCVNANVDQMAQEVQTAFEKHLPMPNLSHSYNLDMSTAYQVQRQFVRSRLYNDTIAGFKAGLTSDDAQASFNINRPIIGILFSKGYKQNQDTLHLKDYQNLMIEAELGFVFKKRIHKKINSVNELKTYVKKIIPVLELPDVAFQSTPIDGVDLVSVNTGSAFYMPQEDVNWLGLNINELTVSMSHNDKIIFQGQGKDALGDQWEALRWLVNQVIAHGWVIEKDYLLITGALGGMVEEVHPGTYSALYNHETTISFRIVE